MTEVFDHQKFVPIAAKAMDSGALLRTRTNMSWDVAGNCERPVYRKVDGAGRPKGMKVWQEKLTARTNESAIMRIEMDTRCRKCGPCRRARAAYWRIRAEQEIAVSGRSWFVTLTLAPEEHFRMKVQASVRLAAQGVEFDRLTADEQFAQRHKEICRELTLWIKRVRKQSGVSLRYLLVAEAHKSGLPHYHALVHETAADGKVTAATLRGQWKLGFTKANLVAQERGSKSAAYVCKYLSKSALSRVRASQGYGQTGQVPGLSHSVNVMGSHHTIGEPPLTPQRTPPDGVFASQVRMGTVQ